MALREYLYIDEKRLNSYFEQISKTPVTYDKIPILETNFGLPSLFRAVLKQSRFGRSTTNHEKIHMLDDYLRRNNSLKEVEHTRALGYSFHDIHPKKFCSVVFEAIKIIIPEKSDEKHMRMLKSLNLWMSLDQDLFLLEDIPFDVQDTHDMRPSIFSRFLCMVDAFRYGGIDLEAENWNIFQKYENIVFTDKDKRRMDCHPLGPPILEINNFLKDVGAILGPKRQIESLFRIRHTCASVVYGYPIFIIEA